MKVPVAGVVEVGAFGVLPLGLFQRLLWVELQSQVVVVEGLSVQVGVGDRCELKRPEFDGNWLFFLDNTGDVAEVAEEVIDTSDVHVSRHFERDNVVLFSHFVFELYRNAFSGLRGWSGSLFRIQKGNYVGLYLFVDLVNGLYVIRVRILVAFLLPNGL